MIGIRILKDRQQVVGFECSGHAGYDESGFDIVCSAVSALTINTANSIDQLTEDDLSVEERDGYLKVQVKAPVSAETSLLLKSLLLGLESIREGYGEEYIRIYR